ncbi:Ubiquitin-protein ligase E3B [Lamellibrachia satsuma]|nr:Ubiquitin-protein ligase E3B [Lamellibrachia satsuma]
MSTTITEGFPSARNRQKLVSLLPPKPRITALLACRLMSPIVCPAKVLLPVEGWCIATKQHHILLRLRINCFETTGLYSQPGRMFGKAEAKKEEFLNQAKVAREQRAQVKTTEHGIIKIQALIRRYLVRCRLHTEIWAEVDAMLQIPVDQETEYKPTLKPATEVFKIIQKFLFLLRGKNDPQRYECMCKYILLSMNKQRYECMCKYILLSMNADNIKYSYVSLALSKDHVLAWIQQLKSVLLHCCSYFKILKPELPRDMKMITTCLHMLIMFTSAAKWKIVRGKAGELLRPGLNQLCNNVMGYLNTQGFYPALQILLTKGLARSKPCFKPASLAAVMTLALRPLIAAEFSTNLTSVFLLHVLSVPAVIYHLSAMAPECLVELMKHRIFSQSLVLLSNEQSTKIIFNTLEGNYALCLLETSHVKGPGVVSLKGPGVGLVEHTEDFMRVVTRLLKRCQTYVKSNKSSLTHWHPVLGWFSQRADHRLHEAMPFVVKQLRLLWSVKMIHLLFEDMFSYNDQQVALQMAKSAHNTERKSIFKKVLEKASTSKQSSAHVKLTSPVVMSTCVACDMYLTSIQTLAQLKTDVLAGLSCQDVLLPRLWKLLTDLGVSDCGLRVFLDVLAMTPNDTSHPVFSMLRLGCDIASHVITIIDDIEMYEQHKPFSADNLQAISNLLNYFIFRILWQHYLDIKAAVSDPLFNSVHSLLMILYERDCRRSYTPAGHWLIRDIKASFFIAELDRGKKAAQFLLQRVPHIIPHRDRVILFRSYVMKEKVALGLTESMSATPQSTLITVHRSRIVEDGYRQLALLPPTALKGTIRVKFVNEQGLDEAGIDQDGVFKEFLEETIKKVFDPSLNLFKATSEHKLYPSPLSFIQENHLALFEFVGRILAKAVYEGIVVEVPFASFFLSQILGHQHSATYSSIDELPSLDPELYRSLTYIKHCEDEIDDLQLTFSYDEDVMGKIVTHELVPGGQMMPVTSENKISYVHLMAHFKMSVQIREQTTAFLHGFKSIINTDWLVMFSAPELQKLVSGDTTDLDLDDLRRHTHYYGGFHDNHRVISWLWDILRRDFTQEEKGAFLKFVTSCSKSPLLGFAHLEPPFSIRCVEVSDDQDTGDTVGSVLKGFFNIHKTEPASRLPTSSTCFNLLKLPNYQRKSTLREKLRYAITSNTGFELS